MTGNVIGSEKSAPRLILLSEIISMRERKENELKFYNEKLAELVERRDILQREIDLTNSILKLIEEEKVVDLRSMLADQGSEASRGE